MKRLRLVLEVESGGGTEMKAALTSLDQGNAKVPVAKTVWSGGTLRLDMPIIKASYEGRLEPDGITLAGVFTQNASRCRSSCYVPERGQS